MKTYKPNIALVKRLLIKLNPEFFALPLKEQDRARQLFLFEHAETIYTYLYKELFGLPYDADSDDEQLNPLQLNQLNAHTTAVFGIGENCFRLNELHGPKFDLTQFSTLRDYDKHEFEFQQDARKKHAQAGFVDRPYRLYLHHLWARALNGDASFCYLTLSSLSYHLLDKLESPKRDLVDELIPNEWIKGGSHGKSENGGFILDWKKNAYGRERELEELQDRVREYQNARYHALNDEFHGYSPAIYLIERDADPNELSINVIMNNAAAAEQVRFTHFFRDCTGLSKAASEIEELEKREVALQEIFIRAEYQDICENFDPTVVRFKKKYKVVFSEGAIEDLNQILSEDAADDPDENDPKTE